MFHNRQIDIGLPHAPRIKGISIPISITAAKARLQFHSIVLSNLSKVNRDLILTRQESKSARCPL